MFGQFVPSFAGRARRLAAPFAHVGKTHDGIDQVAVGGQFQSIHAGAHQGLSQIGFTLGGNTCEAVAKACIVGVHQQLLAGFRIADGEQSDVGQRQLQRVEQAHRHHFVALCQLARVSSRVR